MTSSTPPPDRPGGPSPESSGQSEPPPGATTPGAGASGTPAGETAPAFTPPPAQPQAPAQGYPPPQQPQYPPPPAPPQQPQYPPPQYGGPQYGYAPAQSVRPGLATGAAVTMIIMGSLVVLFGLLLLIAGAFIGGAGNAINTGVPGFGGIAGAVAGVVIVIALIVLALGILDIVSGAYVLGGRPWARVTGIVVSSILAVFGLLSLFGGSQNSNVLFGLILLLANAFVIWALATTGAWFAPRPR